MKHLSKGRVIYIVDDVRSGYPEKISTKSNVSLATQIVMTD